MGNEDTQKVSIVMNCYNGEKYLALAIKSVLDQTHKNWELIFWDNRSLDNSARIFKSHRDSRLKYFYAPEHTNISVAKNFAIKEATGDFIAFLDVDDWWMPNKLEEQLKLFHDPKVGLVCSNYWIYNQNKNKKWKHNKKAPVSGWALNDQLRQYKIGLLTLIIRKDCLNSFIYPCDPRYHIIGDFDLVMKILVDWKLGYVDMILAFYRMHSSNETSIKRSQHALELRQWVREMELKEYMKTQKNFKIMKIAAEYFEAIDLLMKKNKQNAIKIFWQMPMCLLKLKLFLVLMIPSEIFRVLKR